MPQSAEMLSLAPELTPELIRVQLLQETAPGRIAMAYTAGVIRQG